MLTIVARVPDALAIGFDEKHVGVIDAMTVRERSHPDIAAYLFFPDPVKHRAEIRIAKTGDLHVFPVFLPVVFTFNKLMILDHGIALQNMHPHLPEKTLLLFQYGKRFS